MQKKRTFKAAFTCRWAPSDGKDGHNGNDGVGIKTADVVFKLSTSDTQQPNDAGWVTLFSQLQLKEQTYVWSCTRIELTSGATTYTGKQCLGSSKDFVTITEQYAVGNSPTTAPTSGWGTTYTPTKELWLWTRNRMKWTNGTYTYTTAICIGYFGKDGQDGEPGTNGIDAVSFSVSQTAILAKPSAKAQTFIVHVKGTRGNTPMKYGDEFICSTLSENNNITDGLLWSFKKSDDGYDFQYFFILAANASVTVDIPFTITDAETQQKYQHAISFATVYDGTNGVPGMIVRNSEWHEGVTYHNDEDMNITLRYLDVVTVTATDGSFEVYQCRQTHTATLDNAPSAATSKLWVPVNKFTTPIYTHLIIANNAVLRFGQTNRFLIMDTTGTKVQGCITGVDSPTKPMVWFGGETASEANFSLGYDGIMKAQKGIFGGVIMKSKTLVTPENFLDYFKRVNDYDDVLWHYEMEWGKLSMFFELKGDFSEFMEEGARAVHMYAPGIRTGLSYSIEQIEEARSFVGASVCICNSSSTTFAFTYGTGHLNGDKISFVSPTLNSGQIMYMSCVAASGENDTLVGETIGWDFVITNQATVIE